MHTIRNTQDSIKNNVSKSFERVEQEVNQTILKDKNQIILKMPSKKQRNKMTKSNTDKINTDKIRQLEEELEDSKKETGLRAGPKEFYAKLCGPSAYKEDEPIIELCDNSWNARAKKIEMKLIWTKGF